MENGYCPLGKSVNIGDSCLGNKDNPLRDMQFSGQNSILEQAKQENLRPLNKNLLL
jgi:hypothetical protein